MRPSYQGNAKPYAVALYHAADEARVMPVIEALDQKGLNLSYRQGKSAKKNVIKRACAVIAFLSARSGEDQRTERAILLAKAMDVPLVCVRLDQTPLHESLERLLYTSNSITAERYPNPEQLGERILTAESLVHPKLTRAQIIAARRMALLLMAGALVIVAAAGLLIAQRLSSGKETKQAQTPDIAGILSSGMTEEDLLNIRTLILVGDKMINPYELHNYRDWSEVVSKMEIDGKTVWSMDGKQIPRGTATDISLIGRMINLQDLILLNQSVTDISPLQGLKTLSYVEFVDCPVESLEALSGMSVLRGITLEQTQVSSLKPLESCVNLEGITCDIEHCTSLDGLGIPALSNIVLLNAFELTDLDALSACSKLEDLTIHQGTKLNDVSGLAGCTWLSRLEIDEAPALRSFEGLSALTKVKEVMLQNCGVSDLSALKNSRGLQRLEFQDTPVRSLDWTAGLDNLQFVMMHGTRMHSMDFLKNLGVDSMELHFSGGFDDYSGLAAISYYSYMHLNPNDRNLDAVLPYIVNAKFSRLELYDCDGIDFAKLPQQINVLTITGGNLSSLEGISVLPDLNTLYLDGLNRLSSLKGLAECKELMRITIQSCLRLTDYETLYEKPYAILEFNDLLVAPDLSRLQIGAMGNLSFMNMPSISDISPLAANQTQLASLTLKDMTSIIDISALRQMQVDELVVSPQLEAQAQQLKDENVINSYRVEYPENEFWTPSDEKIELMSLEELDTLPDELLQRVEEVNLIGDCLLDPETQNWTDQWENNTQYFYVSDRASGEGRRVGEGTLTEIGSLGKLTKLQSLRLYDQPLTSLQGIQNMPELRFLEMRKGPLTDAAAAFTLTNMERLSLFNTKITSIQGVQNLTKLILLDINGTQVADISPLSACDFSYAMENGGFELQIGYTPCNEFTALASIPGFASLNIEGHEAALWLPYLAGKPIRSLYANHCDLTNEQVALLAAIPNLEELQLCWNEKLTDLTPLLSCPTLKKLVLNGYSAEAIASIEGKAQFTIEYRD